MTPPSLEPLVWLEPVAERPETLEVQVQEVATSASRRYFLLDRDAPPHAPVVTILEESIDAAAEVLLLPDLRATTPFPVGRDGLPPAGIPEMKVAITYSGGRFLVGEADWGDVGLTHEVVWRSFGAERALLEREWRSLARDVERG